MPGSCYPEHRPPQTTFHAFHNHFFLERFSKNHIRDVLSASLDCTHTVAWVHYITNKLCGGRLVLPKHQQFSRSGPCQHPKHMQDVKDVQDMQAGNGFIMWKWLIVLRTGSRHG